MAAFAGLGVTASFVPAVLPAAGRATAGDLDAAVPALFGGLLAGVLASGPLLRAVPAVRVLQAGGALQALAVVVAACAADAAPFVAAAVLAGVGFGLVEAAGSVAAKAVARGSATGLLSTLTGTVAVSAAVTPLLVAAGASVRPALAGLAVVPVVSVVLLGSSTAGGPRARGGGARLRARTLLPLLPVAVALPLYVGVETVLSGWSAVIPERALGLSPSAAALGTSAFWALMALGRFCAAGMRRRGVRPGTILVAGSAGAAVLLAGAGALVGTAPALALAGVAGAVVALAPTYALVLGLALDRLDVEQSTVLTGALVACGAAGGTFVPAAVLVVGHDPASAGTFTAAAALCALVPALVLAGTRRRR